MPYTLNGIGTHYYGTKNRSAHVGTCQACGHQATLSSYDTREFFCVLFIPLIPIRKYRIIDQCSRCTRHHRMAASEFAKNVAEKTEPLREAIRRSPRDPQPYLELIQTLIGWEMRADAERELESAIAVFPSNVGMMVLAAQLAVERGDWDRALPLYERAQTVEPQNAAATYGYGWLLHQMGRHEQAIPVLQRAVGQDGGNKVGSLYLLGTSQLKLSRWNEALNSYQQLLNLDAAYQRDKKLLRVIADCKKHIGYELTDAERRAARSWWPFGRKVKPVKPMKPGAAPALVRPGLRYAGYAILAIVVLGLAVTAWDRKTNIDLYVDNGLSRGLKVDLDGKQFFLGAKTPHKEVLKSGKHSLVVRETDGKELERFQFSVDELPVLELLHDRFFVYNIASERVYRRATHGYAVSTSNQSYSEKLIAMQRFFEQRDVDFPFMPAPQSVELDSASSVAHKVSFNPAADISLRRYALIRLHEGKADEAKRAIEQAVAGAPCDPPTRRAQLYITSALETSDRSAAIARRWISDCAQDDLEAHRAYQDIAIADGNKEALRDEYARLVASSPESAKAHYLNGRLAADPAVEIAEYETAVRLDPNLMWAHIALGHAYQTAERHDDALHELSLAMALPDYDASAITYYATSAIAKGAPETAVPVIETVKKTRPREFAPLEARWLLAAACGEWKEANAITETLADAEAPEMAWWRKTQLLRLANDRSVDRRIEHALKEKDLVAAAAMARIERLIESGKFQEAADETAKYAGEIDPETTAMFEAYEAGGLLVQRDPRAAELLDRADQTIAANPKTPANRVTAAVVSGLRGSMPVDAVLTLARANDLPMHGWFVAAVRAAMASDRTRARESFAHCVSTSSDLEFPYLEAKAMAERLGGS